MATKRTKTAHTAGASRGRRRPVAAKALGGRATPPAADLAMTKPMLIGYARVSTVDQNLALQRDALTESRVPEDFHRADVGCGYRPPGFA